MKKEVKCKNGMEPLTPLLNSNRLVNMGNLVCSSIIQPPPHPSPDLFTQLIKDS